MNRLFSNDGSVAFNGKRIRVAFCRSKREEQIALGLRYMNEIKSMLLLFGIRSSNIYRSKNRHNKHGYTSIALNFEIRGTRKNMDDVRSFQKFIGFSNTRKRKRLKDAILTLSRSKPS